MSKYTPGPWEVGDGMRPFFAWPGQVLGKDESGETFILASANQNYPELAIANARLIAAAPELLEALKREHREHFDSYGWMFHQDDESDCPVCQLIKRAEG